MFPSGLQADVVGFSVGLPVSFNGQVLLLGAVTTRPRPADQTPGSSSPVWVETMVVGPTAQIAQDAAAAEGIVNQPDPSCTGSSKQALLIVAGPTAADRKHIPNVEILVTDGSYELAAPGGAKNDAEAARVTTDVFDPNPAAPPATLDAKVWRVMSDLCEALFRNFA